MVGSSRRYVSGRSQAEVAAKITALKADTARGLTPAGASLTVANYLDGWLQRIKPRVRASTWVGYESLVRLYLIPHLGRTPLARLVPSQIESMTAKITAEGHGPTAWAARRALRVALNDAARDGLIARNSAALARPPKVTRQTLTVLDPSQIRALIAGTEADPHGPLLAVLALTGLRSGEALGLRWRDLDLERQVLHVRHALVIDHEHGRALGPTKTSGSHRTLDLGPSAISAFKRQHLRQAAMRVRAGSSWVDNDLVFSDRHGGYLNKRGLNDALADAVERLGLPESLRVHDLRHSYATALLTQGVNVRVIASLLGHTDATMVLRTYGHALPNSRREAIDVLERTVGAG